MIEGKGKIIFILFLGNINKKVISGKIFNLIKKIKNENKKNNNENEINTNNSSEKIEIKNASHLDLTESEETSIINEFFYHFFLLNSILIMK